MGIDRVEAIVRTLRAGANRRNVIGTAAALFAGVRGQRGAVAQSAPCGLGAKLDGDNELDPVTLERGAGDPDGAGSACVDLGEDEACWVVTAKDIGNVILAHIHRGDRTVNGPVVIDFEGSLDACVPVSAALLAEIRGNPAGFYVNVHTDEFESGAIRGQLFDAVARCRSRCRRRCASKPNRGPCRRRCATTCGQTE